MKIIAYLHTHWDREWYRTFEEFRFRFFEVFDDIVKKLENNEFSQFYLDGQTILIDDLLEICPSKKILIQSLIEQKKIVIGPWYTLADEFLVSGESLIRNLLIGTKQAKSYGVEDFLGYLPDAFGHSIGMVDILSSFGIKNALLWRGAGTKKSEFVWQSKSGAKITVTHLLEGYFQDYFTSGNIDGVKNLINKIKTRNIGDLILLPIGADHLGACDDLPQKIADFNAQNDDKIEVGSVFDYLNQSKTNLETFQEELRDNSNSFILPGTYSTRNYLKRLNALTTWELKKVETLAALCDNSGISDSYKNFVDYAWKLLLQNHAHDSICGCSVDAVHSEMELRFAKINQLLTTIKDKTLTKFENGRNLTIFNSSGFNFSGTIELQTTEKLTPSDGFELVATKVDFPSKIVQNIQQIPVSEDLTKVYTYLASIKNAKGLGLTQVEPTLNSDLKITKTSLENSFVLVKIEKDGTLTLKDKITGKVYQNALAIEDIADIGDTYNFSPVIEDAPIRADFVQSKVIFDGKTRAVLELKYKISIPKNSTKSGRTKSKSLHDIKIQLTLDNESSILKFKTDFENKAKNHLLQAKITLPNNITKTFSEDSIGLVERDFDAQYNLQNQKPAVIFEELKTNTAPMQRFVWTQGIGVLTKGLHEYEVAQNTLGITLLRAIGMLSGRELHSRFNAAGPTIPTNEAQCLRSLTCEFAISFCAQAEELFEKADNYFDPTISFLTEKSPSQEITIGNKNINVLALKSAENVSGIVLRLLNTSNENQKTDLTGIPVTSKEIATTKSAEAIVLKPYELKSVLIYQNS